MLWRATSNYTKGAKTWRTDTTTRLSSVPAWSIVLLLVRDCESQQARMKADEMHAPQSEVFPWLCVMPCMVTAADTSSEARDLIIISVRKQLYTNVGPPTVQYPQS